MFQDCLIESVPAAREQHRWKTNLLAAGLESCLLAAILSYPLLHPESLPLNQRLAMPPIVLTNTNPSVEHTQVSPGASNFAVPQQPEVQDFRHLQSSVWPIAAVHRSIRTSSSARRFHVLGRMVQSSSPIWTQATSLIRCSPSILPWRSRIGSRVPWYCMPSSARMERSRA